MKITHKPNHNSNYNKCKWNLVK